MHPPLLYQLTNNIHERHCEILQRSLNPEANTSAGQLIELMSGNDDVVISARANHLRIARTHPSTGWPAVPCERRSMADLLVSFHSQCRGVKFYELRSAGAEWGTKLKLVKEPANPHDPLVAWVPGIPGERGADGARPLMLGHVAKETASWLNELLDVPSLRVTR